MISSHILDELGKLADAYGIIHEGELIDEFTTDELSQRCGQYVTVKTDNNEKAMKVLQKNGFSEVKIDDEKNNAKKNMESLIAYNCFKFYKIENLDSFLDL